MSGGQLCRSLVQFREAREEVIDLGAGRRAQHSCRLALGIGGDDPPSHEHVFANGKPDTLLLLVADQGQMGVEKVVSRIPPAGPGEPHDFDEHVRNERP